MITASPGGFGPTNSASPFAQPPNADRSARPASSRRTRRLCASVAASASQRRDVVHDPDPATVRRDHEIVIARMDREVAHGDRRQVATLVPRPVLAAVHRDPEAELRPEEEELAG